MVKPLIKGTILGGIALFIWGAISWMVLPWHNFAMYGFKDEVAVTQTLFSNAPQNGIYILPNPHRQGEESTQEEIKAKSSSSMEQMIKGPVLFAAVSLDGSGSMVKPMIGSLLIQMLGALLVTFLILEKNNLTYWERVGFAVLFALAAGIVCHLPYWNWWSFSALYTLVTIMDLVVGWFLAGLVIAQVAIRQS